MKTEAAVAVYVYAGTITSSSFPIPNNLRVISNAAVHEFNATVLALFTKLVISFQIV